MKSERRHELQHNELADWLANTVAAVKPYQNLLLSGVLIVVLAFLGYTVWSRMAASESAKAWDEVNAALDAGNIPRLAEVIESCPGTSAAHMAAVVLADNYLGEGCNRLFTNKALGVDDLNKAIQLYDVVRQECPRSTLYERATFGLARAKESKGDAESIKQAERLYEEVATKTPTGTFTVAAAERLADLKRPSTMEFYDNFRKFSTAAFSTPDDRPDFDSSSLPAEGSTEMPSAKVELKQKPQDDNASKAAAKEAEPKAAATPEKKEPEKKESEKKEPEKK